MGHVVDWDGRGARKGLLLIRTSWQGMCWHFTFYVWIMKATSTLRTADAGTPLKRLPCAVSVRLTLYSDTSNVTQPRDEFLCFLCSIITIQLNALYLHSNSIITFLLFTPRTSFDCSVTYTISVKATLTPICKFSIFFYLFFLFSQMYINPVRTCRVKGWRQTAVDGAEVAPLMHSVWKWLTGWTSEKMREQRGERDGWMEEEEKEINMALIVSCASRRASIRHSSTVCGRSSAEAEVNEAVLSQHQPDTCRCLFNFHSAISWN